MEDELLPEDVLCEFAIANLRGVESEIRPLIVEHPDAALLWQGAYPTDVATLLAELYDGMEIVRVEEAPDRVLLQSSVAPFPLGSSRSLENGGWTPLQLSELADGYRRE